MDDRFETDRLEAFSDGVFAIAITLLVLELSVPEDDFDDLFAGILDQWPSYLAYLTSFLTIGGVWLVHHAILRRMRWADAWIVRVNLVLLLVAAIFVPQDRRVRAPRRRGGHRGASSAAPKPPSSPRDVSQHEPARSLFLGCCPQVRLPITGPWTPQSARTS